MGRNVRGVLFADYVRMIRAVKGAQWSADLTPEDLSLISEHIEPEEWYPMATFERLGNAILRVVANADLNAVRMWGRFSVEPLRAENPQLVAPGNPVETLMRFRVLRSTYFDFEALEIPTLAEDHARVILHYFMGNVAEEAASYQTMGFMERLLELAGAADVQARLVEKTWEGAARTVLDLNWRLPLESERP